MQKWVGRLAGFAVFLCIFGSVAAAVVAASTGLIDLGQVFPALPEPPQIDVDRFAPPRPDLPDIPDIDLPDGLEPGNRVYLGERVARRPLVARIPAPQQLVTDPRVVGTNLFLAILMALVFGATSTMLGNMLRDEEPRIRDWLRVVGIEKLVAWVGRVFRWSLGKAAVRRGCLSLPLVIVIFALYGIIFAFLEEGTSVLSREGAFLAVTMAFSVGLVSFGGDLARRIAGQLWRTPSRFNLYPVNLGIAAVTVVLSRLLHLSPGIAFGTPGGADINLPDTVRQRREVTLALLELALVALLGGLGWATSGVILALLDQPVAGRAIDLVAAVLTAAQNTGLALFFVALETLFFETLPLAYGTGQTLIQWSKVLWVALFVPLAFLFNHVLLNPQSGFLDSFLVSNVRFLWFVLLALVGITAGLWFYFNVVDDMLKALFGIRPGAPR